jgi:hypothetical protein
MVTINVKVDALRKTVGLKTKMGRVDCSKLGLTYRGQSVVEMIFQRYEKVHYVSPSGVAFATFQDDAAIDD